MADTERGATGNVQGEIDKYVLLLAKDPSSRVFAPLAEAYRKAGLLDDAIQTAEDGLKVHPNYLSGRVALGRAYYEKKMLAEAREEFQKVVKSAPDNLMAHKVLGQIAYDQSDLPSALKAFEMVVLLDPRDQEAKLFLEKLGGGARSAAAPPPIAVAPPPSPAPPVVAAPVAPPPVVAPPPIAPPAPAPLAPPPVMAPPPVPPPLPEAPPEMPAEMPAEMPEMPPAAPPVPQDLPVSELSMEDIVIDEAPPTQEAIPEPFLEPMAEPVEEPILEPFPEPPPAAPVVTEEPAIAVEPAPPPEEIPQVLVDEVGAGVAPDLPAPPAPAAQEMPAIEELPLEVFSREPGGEAVAEENLAVERTAYEAAAPGAPGESVERLEVDQTSFDLTPEMAAPPLDEGARGFAFETTAYETPAATAPPVEEESPFEVFGRPTRTPPPVSAKGEEPMREIDLEATAHEPVVEEPEADDASPFQVFTRDPRVEARAAPPKESRGEGGTYRELDLESPGQPVQAVAEPEVVSTTELPLEPAASWVGQSEEWASPPPSGEPVSLEEEIPSIDLTREVEMEDREAPPLPPFPEPPVLEGAGDWNAEPAVAEPVLEAVAEPAVEEKPVAIEDAFEDFGVEVPAEPAPVQLEEEIPSIDLSREIAEAGPVEQAEPESSSASGRGVFDTETLASIYVNQGFYGRAAEIYERLVLERPDDAALRQKLAELQALDRQAAGTPHAPSVAASAPVMPPAMPPAPVAAARPPRPAPPPLPGTGARKDNETIRRLQNLLDGLKGGRPQ
jgi:hypothetical protein